MRFEVPQFVDVEDKIVGPFTWKQFVYLAGGAGTAFILYITFPFILFVVLVAPVAALSLGLAFYEINNRPLALMIEAVVTYLGKGCQYRWKKEEVKESELNKIVVPPPAFGVTGQNNISSLARRLEMKAINKE